MKRNAIEKYRVDTEEWANNNWIESNPLPESTRKFLMDNLVLKIMLLMKQEEIERKETCIRIGDSTRYEMEDMGKVFLRAFSRAYARVHGDAKVYGENKS